MQYRKKPVVIEAVQLTFANWSDICELALTSLRGDGLKGLTPDEAREKFPDADIFNEKIYALIPTLEGPHLATENDYIVRGIKGELYPCKPDIFEASYEAVA